MEKYGQTAWLNRKSCWHKISDIKQIKNCRKIKQKLEESNVEILDYEIKLICIN